MIAILRKAAPWVFFALVVFWTWGPLKFRPSFGHPDLERFGAFFVLAALVALTYRWPKWRIGLAICAAAAILEFGQEFVPGRDARMSDAIAKIAGAFVAVVLIAVFQALARRADPLSSPSPHSTLS